MGKQHVQAGGNGLGMGLETSWDHSVVEIGVVGAVGYSPEPPLGLKKHIIPVVGVLMATRSQPNPFWELSST